jgi:hypothetical protein
MNSAALRAERAVADYLTAATWTDVTEPTCLTSYDRGALSAQSEETADSMPSFPYLIVRAASSNPVHPQDLTHEIVLAVDLYMPADDAEASGILKTVGLLEGLIRELFDTNGAAVLNAAADNANGAFQAHFAFPGDFGGSSVEGRARVFNRTFTLFGSATL